MSRSVVKRERFKRAIAHHAKTIAKDSPTSSGRFLSEIERAIELLLDRPMIGRRMNFENPGLEGVRLWRVSQRFERYLIFYKPIDGGIELLDLFHSRQDYESKLRRLES